MPIKMIKSAIGAEGGNRTRTAFATAPSRRRVYQFHHFGICKTRQTRLTDFAGFTGLKELLLLPCKSC